MVYLFEDIEESRYNQLLQDTVRDHMKPTYHRLQHIVNRNSSLQRTWPQILAAFDETPYEQKSGADKVVISKFFKECDAKDFEALLQFDEIRPENIKAIYLASPHSRSLYRKQWDELLQLDPSERHQLVEDPVTDKPLPRGVALVEEMRREKGSE